MNKKDIEILSVILASPLIIGIIIAGIFRFDLTKGEWITLVTSCVSTFAAIFLGFMVFFQNENHKKRSEEMAKEHERQEQLYRDEERKNREQELLIRTTPYLSFCKIEFAETSSNGTIAITEKSSSCLKYVNNKDYEKRLTDQEFLKKYHRGNLFRFIFNCPQDKGLKNILFKEAVVYPDYPDALNKPVIKSYSFTNNEADVNDKLDFSISYLGNNQYQTCKYFMFPTDEFLRSKVAKEFESDLLLNNTKIFFNIKYEAINIYNVKITGELKFFTTATLNSEKDKIFFTEPTNVSNWLGNPELIERKEKTNESNA